jgi:hypothetical protein
MEHNYLNHEEPDFYVEEPEIYQEERVYSYSEKTKRKNSTENSKKANPLQARRSNIDYKINPNAIPRPNVNDDVYNNSEKTHFFQTEDYTKQSVPFSNSYFIVNETENSSIRFIRPSINKIPTTMDDINKSGLLLGLYIQPFAIQEQGEFKIPSVEGKLY